MSLTDQFWNASFDELKNGYMEQEHHYFCLLCGEQVEKGIIYPEDGVLYDAARYMRVHIEKTHGSVFEHLSMLDKRLTGLSDHQNSLLRLFYQGKNDNEVQKEMGIGSSSTIRNHRFALKEKERQAKVFLVMMELLKESDRQAPKPEKTADNQSASVTPKEYEEITSKCFPEGTAGPLLKFPRKQKHKLVVLREIVKHFDENEVYTEQQINEILQGIYEDHVTLRRYLIDFGFMDRKPDGSQYWVTAQKEEEEGEQMNRKQELKQLYKEVKTEAGVYQIKNTQNEKVWIASTMNLKTMNGKKFMLQQGSHPNQLLQKDWNEWGEDAFVFEVLEVLEKKDDPFFDAPDALEKLEQKWVEKLQPFGERGYHQEKTR